jgi:cytochrome bd-type quinol oxidase subunit 1
MTAAPPASVDDIDEPAARRSRRLTVTILACILAVSFAAGILLAALDPDHKARHHHSALGLIVALGIGALALAVAVAWWLWVYRRPKYRRIMQYGWRRRRRVAKALRRGRPLPAEDLPVAAAITEVLRAQWWLPLLYGFLIVIWALDALTGRGFQRWDAVGLAVLYLVLLPVFVWQRRKMIRNYDRLKSQGTSG